MYIRYFSQDRFALNCAFRENAHIYAKFNGQAILLYSSWLDDIMSVSKNTADGDHKTQFYDTI